MQERRRKEFFRFAIAGNLPAHTTPRIAQLIEDAGARVLRLPPNFNPIEMVISKMKPLLRKQARRIVDEVMQVILETLDSVTADDAINYILYCSYP